MLIINADDFGRNCLATDRILACYKRGSVTSASAMVFMADSLRAAELAREYSMDAGLHVNFTQRIPERVRSPLFTDYHDRLARYLAINKYSFLVYNPVLRNQFDYVFHAQYEEYERTYGTLPSHIDGHHHMHLCANMIIGGFLPRGQIVRRNYSFAPGEKNFANRMYRLFIDRLMGRRYIMTDYLFSLSNCLINSKLPSALILAKSSDIELQTHPEVEDEFQWLSGKVCAQLFSGLPKGNYLQLKRSFGPAHNMRGRQEQV